MLANDPGPGISAWPTSDSLTTLEAQILGPDDSPFVGGTFNLSINIPEQYPFEPPRVRFLTPIYHPNIDSDGRICLDILKMQPQGNWSPSININTILLSIRLLMGSPNAEDGLVADITQEYKRDSGLWFLKAKESTMKHAINSQAGASTGDVVAVAAGAPQASSLEAPSIGEAISSSAMISATSATASSRENRSDDKGIESSSGSDSDSDEDDDDDDDLPNVTNGDSESKRKDSTRKFEILSEGPSKRNRTS